MDIIHVPVTLYSVPQALVFLEGLNLRISDTWLRKRMKSANLKVYHIGKSDFVTETDLYKLSLLQKTKPGPKQKRQGQK
jgi:hypothetical protein